MEILKKNILYIFLHFKLMNAVHEQNYENYDRYLFTKKLYFRKTKKKNKNRMKLNMEKFYVYFTKI